MEFGKQLCNNHTPDEFGYTHIQSFSLNGIRHYCTTCLHVWIGINKPQPVLVHHEDLECHLENGEANWDGLSGREELDKGHGLHYDLIHNADMNYPIYITSDYKILDGCHRFTKNKHLLKKATIKAYIISEEILEEIYSFIDN